MVATLSNKLKKERWWHPCQQCRGYGFERTFCDRCNGSGLIVVEREKPTKKHGYKKLKKVGQINP